MLRIAMSILWPAFLAAALAEAAFFALIDPRDLGHLGLLARLGSLGGQAAEPAAVYTIGFFFFWTLCSLASMITYYLVVVPDEERAL